MSNCKKTLNPGPMKRTPSDGAAPLARARLKSQAAKLAATERAKRVSKRPKPMGS